MKLILLVLGLCLLCFLGMVLYLYVNQRKILYYPQPLDRDWDHVKANVEYEYELERDGVRLRGWLLNPENKHLLVYYGGNGEEASWLIDLFKPLSDTATLLINYRGYGESEGKPTEKDIVADSLALLDAIKGQYDTFVLLGRSLGSGVAVQVAAQCEVDRVILVTPYDSIATVGQGMYPWAPVRLLSKDPFDSLAVAGNVEEPTLFLIAETDSIIPHKHSEALYEAWKEPKQWIVIRDSDHNSITEFPAYWQAVKDFIGAANR